MKRKNKKNKKNIYIYIYRQYILILFNLINIYPID